MMVMGFQHPLGINQSQFRLIRDCLWARTQVPNGHFLPAPRWKRAAEKLIELGYLSKAPSTAQPVPAGGWAPVVLITNANIEAYNRDLAAVEAAGAA